MAAHPQQQSLFRKLLYFALILVLFGATLLMRQSVLLPRAEALGLREKSQGEVELTGSAIRLLLTGSRGLAVCVFWVRAQDEQMRNEWNQLELTVRALTKLQPHFITPWLFQSWNLAYNVSVESDRIRDKYFYISRGIELLADGERQNQNNPDLRHHLGLYYQGKLGLSDEQTTFRCLFQMSSIDPLKRRGFREEGSSAINVEKFRRFCEEHPFLVRRLREQLRCQTPQEVVEFLEANYKVPSRFDEEEATPGSDTAPLREPATTRFPVLPPEAPRMADYEFKNDAGDLPDDFDNFLAARAWFSYAQEPLEPPLSRMPKHVGWVIVFQGYPPRAQAYYAERLQKEGWFDEAPWEVSDWFSKPGSGPDGPRETVTFGDPRFWSGDAWNRAYEMYLDHGRAHFLNLSPEEETKLTQVQKGVYDTNRRVTNFEHFLTSTDVERTRPAVLARKSFWIADRFRRRGERRKAMKTYEDVHAFGSPETWDKDHATGWLRIFYDHPKFRADQRVQEDAFELEMKYLDLVAEVYSNRVLGARTSVAVLLAAASPDAFWRVPAELYGQTGTPRVRGPMDGYVSDDNGKTVKPLINAEARRVVNARRGSLAPPTATPVQPALVPGLGVSP